MRLPDVHSLLPAKTARIVLRPAVHGAVLAIAAVALLASVDPFSYVGYQVQLVAVYAIAALGLDVVVGMSGSLSLASAAAFALGAYTTAILAGSYGWPLWATVPTGCLLGFVAGAVIGLPAARLGHIGLAMLSLGCTVVVVDIVMNATDLTGGYGGLFNIPPLASFGGRDPVEPMVLALAIVGCTYLVYVGHWAYRTSAFGRRALAVREDPIGAKALGIRPVLVLAAAFATATGIGALSGGFYAYLNGVITPDTINWHLSITMLAMVLLGGAGSRLGPLLGAAILTIVPIYLSRYPHINQFLYGALLIVVVRVMIKGLLPARPPALGDRLAPFRDTASLEAGARGGQAPATGSATADEPGRGPTAVGEPLLEVRDVSRGFGGNVVLRNVSLTVRAGEVVSVIGPNGSGKTTLLNVISHFYPPSAGQILLAGRALTGTPASIADAGVRRTFQTPRTFAGLSVAEHLLLADDERRRHGGDERYMTMALRLLARSGVEVDRGAGRVQDVNELSHGQRRFLEIATAIASGPRVLLLDEPAAGLSASEIAILRDAVREIAATGTAVLLVEHHVDLVTEISDRVLVLHLGSELWSGPPDQLKGAEEVSAAYLGTSHKTTRVTSPIQTED
jgi:branched-chain amino acid transport system permease protein